MKVNGNGSNENILPGTQAIPSSLIFGEDQEKRCGRRRRRNQNLQCPCGPNANGIESFLVQKTQ